MTRRWGIPDGRVTSLLANGVYSRLAARCLPYVGPAARSRVARSIHHQFSTRLARRLPAGADVLIGLSCFTLEALARARALGMATVIDHGSLHPRVERRLLLEESERFGLPPEPQLPEPWFIDKEEEEFRAADRVIVMSGVARRTLVEQGVPAEKIFVSHPGVSLEQFSPGTKHDDVFRVIHCGTINPRKGVHYLVQAFHELDLPRAELWLIGGGAARSSLASILRRYAHPRIHLKGAHPQGELHRLYAQGSVFVLASVADGFGMVVPQAMACGLPAIVTDNVGAADIVDEGVSGHVVPARDVEALKARLLALYRDPSAARDMGAAARRAVQAGRTWDDYGDRLVAFLRDLVEGAR
jgi:glycosyltransferase involved in cell wall biosynthesis